MNFYETLGIEPDATDEQIKAAWRRASSQAHPDKDTGSHERQQAVNAAYECLSDRTKRAQYDESGGLDPNSIEAKAQAHLDGVLREGIQTGLVDPLVFAMSRIGEAPRLLKAQLVRMQNDKARTELKLGKTRRKDGKRNRVEDLLRQHIAALDLQHRQASEALQVANECLRLLAQYESLEPAKPKTLVMQYGDALPQAQGRAFS